MGNSYRRGIRPKNALTLNGVKRAVQKGKKLYVVCASDSISEYHFVGFIDKQLSSGPSVFIKYDHHHVLTNDRTVMLECFVAPNPSHNTISANDCNCTINGYNDYFIFDHWPNVVEHVKRFNRKGWQGWTGGFSS